MKRSADVKLGADRQDNQITAVIVAILIVALWLATRRYMGVFHDSRFYTLMALAWLTPERFASDLFLAFGSQDRFSLFSPIYGTFLKLLGVTSGNMILLWLANTLWLAGITMLARVWLGNWRLAATGIVAVIALPGGIVLVFGESFLTPRLPAEALTLIALATMIRGHSVAAALLMTLALLLHPLTSLPGFAILVLYEGRQRRFIWGVVAILIGVSLTAMLAGIEPFARLAQTFDPEWLKIVYLRNNYCFVSTWDLSHWLPLINMIGFALLGLSFGPRANRPLLFICLAVGLGGVALAYVGGDLLHNVLLTDIQAARWTWPLAVVSFMSCAPIVLNAGDRADTTARASSELTDSLRIPKALAV